MRLVIASALAVMLFVFAALNQQGIQIFSAEWENKFNSPDAVWIFLVLSVFIFLESLVALKRGKAAPAEALPKVQAAPVEDRPALAAEAAQSKQEFLALNERYRELLERYGQAESALTEAQAKLAKQADLVLTSRSESVDAELVNLLSVLQQRGRLIDFGMSDIAPYSDAQIGAAARAVQQGLQGALKEYFVIEPVAAEAEGAKVELPVNYDPSDYRLVGKVPAVGPFAGRLVHKGWRCLKVKLPRLMQKEGIAKDIIAPGEVEIGG